MRVSKVVMRWMVPGLCLLVGYGALLSGLHHHSPATDRGACVACAAGHSQAVPVTETIARPGVPAEREALLAPAAAPWVEAAPEVGVPRAPPLS